jgi:hypothetical protein
MVDIYIITEAECEALFPSPPSRYPLIESVLECCENGGVHECWIRISGSTLAAPALVTDIAKHADSLLTRNMLSAVHFQTHVESLVHLSTISGAAGKIELSCIICTKPMCGITGSDNVIATLRRLGGLFKSVSIAGSSPITCTALLGSASNARRPCLMRHDMLFVLPSGLVSHCPLGHVAPLGDLALSSLDEILVIGRRRCAVEQRTRTEMQSPRQACRVECRRCMLTALSGGRMESRDSQRAPPSST